MGISEPLKSDKGKSTGLQHRTGGNDQLKGLNKNRDFYQGK